jgi:HEAT repeat protein
MRPLLPALALIFPLVLFAQDVRPKDVREVAKDGVSSLPKLEEFLKNQNRDVRLEAVRQITDIGTQRSLDPLIGATRDNDPEVQIRAANGLVNFYYPGYVKTGLAGAFRSVSTSIKSRFTDVNDDVVDSYVTARPEVITALGQLVTRGGSSQSRANAARAVGVLRGSAATDDLMEGVRSKDSDVIYESLVALQKIGDQSGRTSVAFRVRDLDPRVQVTAIETAGLLRDKGARPALIDIVNRTKDAKVKRAALAALAAMPDETDRPLFEQFLGDKDERLRSASAEGLGRLKNPADLPKLEKAWKDEGKTAARLSLAFAMVMLGRTETGEFSPLQYLINTLNSGSYRGEAFPLLVELARDAKVRTALYGPVQTGTKAERMALGHVLARSGDSECLPELQKLSKDEDTEVAQEGLRALRILKARI